MNVFVQFVIPFDTKIINLEDGQMTSRSFRGDHHHISQFEHLVSAIYFIPFNGQPWLSRRSRKLPLGKQYCRLTCYQLWLVTCYLLLCCITPDVHKCSRLSFGFCGLPWTGLHLLWCKKIVVDSDLLIRYENFFSILQHSEPLNSTGDQLFTSQ